MLTDDRGVLPTGANIKRPGTFSYSTAAPTAGLIKELRGSRSASPSFNSEWARSIVEAISGLFSQPSATTWQEQFRDRGLGARPRSRRRGRRHRGHRRWRSTRPPAVLTVLQAPAVQQRRVRQRRPMLITGLLEQEQWLRRQVGEKDSNLAMH